MDHTTHALDVRLAGLRRHPAVAEAVVTTHGDKTVVYVLTAEGHAFDAAELRRHLERQPDPLPGTTALVGVPELPRTPDGAVDHAELPVYGVLGGLLALWREVFENDDVGPDDDFFGLGGYSMLALRLVVRIADRYGTDLPLADFFDLPAARDVAYRLVELGADATAPEAPARTADELDLEALLADVDLLSDEQARTLLGPDGPPAGPGTAG